MKINKIKVKDFKKLSKKEREKFNIVEVKEYSELIQKDVDNLDVLGIWFSNKYEDNLILVNEKIKGFLVKPDKKKDKFLMVKVSPEEEGTFNDLIEDIVKKKNNPILFKQSKENKAKVLTNDGGASPPSQKAHKGEVSFPSPVLSHSKKKQGRIKK